MRPEPLGPLRSWLVKVKGGLLRGRLRRAGALRAALAIAVSAHAPALADETSSTVSVQAVAPTGDGKARVSECSGVLIAPDVVLTAGHCLDIAADASRVAVFAYRDGKPVPSPMIARAIARHPGHVVGWRDRPGDPEQRQAEISSDLALIRLAAPAGPPLGFGSLPAGDGVMTGTGPSSAGGASGAIKRVTLSAIRASTGQGARVAFASASATVCGGDSGGPALSNGAVWGVVAAVLKPNAGCGRRLAIALVDPASDGFRAMRAGLGPR